MTIPHLTLDPNITFPISIAVITILLAGYGIYRGFFANQNLTDPWDDHDAKSHKTPLRYPGGKSRALSKLFQFIPNLSRLH